MNQPSHTNDDGIVGAVRAGDRTAMNELVRRYLPMVYSLVRQALQDDPDVDDAVQDIMVRALGTSAAHAAVRIQRMREQLEESRRIVAALEAMPGCDTLGDVGASWDGTPTAYWRKRLGRHVRSCALCPQAAGDLLPTDRLLVGLVLLPVPAALGAAVLAKALFGGAAAGSATSVASGVTVWLSRVMAAATAHPVVAAVRAGVLAVGVVVPTTGWISSAPPGRAVAVIPQRVPELKPPTSELKTGPVALESAAAPGRFLAVSGDRRVLAPIGPASDAAARERATLVAVAGLADPHCFSFRRPTAAT